MKKLTATTIYEHHSKMFGTNLMNGMAYFNNTLTINGYVNIVFGILLFLLPMK